MTLEEIIDSYCVAWSQEDAASREQLLAQTLLPEVTYCDPTADLSGRVALSDHISAVLAKRPGSLVQRTSAIDLHHDMARFAWHLRNADGTTLPEGLDVVAVDAATGKLKSIIGFFGALDGR